MTKATTLILTAFLSFSMINACHSQYNSGDRDLETIGGKVISVDIMHSSITIKAVNQMKFSVPADTPITCSIYDSKLSNIKPGDDVTVEHYKDGSGNLIATKITVENKENCPST
jgi:hypothetical protein